MCIRDRYQRRVRGTQVTQHMALRLRLAEALGAQLEGRVFLYFGSAWCPDCGTATTAVAGECAGLADGAPHTLVYVSSDRSVEQMEENTKKFGSSSVLPVPYTSELRQELKQETGCFAGSEQSNWPEVTRLHGIPTLFTLDEAGDQAVFVKEW
eukprot:TRINITY_DN2158_c0_g1_i1.p1 TRINITY_DN2158_c0_g1~~TRINITY_DN2158_c0_g1_i1.p1  ORF type:complete len:153 (-),score=35.95 TRINITY_DN2158_c0_g1_i1:364-822(-)